MSLSHLLKAAGIGSEMIERRNRLRLLYGQRYADLQKMPRQLLQAMSKQEGCTLLQAGLKVCKQAVEDGHGEAVNPVIAAMVDLIEEQGA